MKISLGPTGPFSPSPIDLNPELFQMVPQQSVDYFEALLHQTAENALAENAEAVLLGYQSYLDKIPTSDALGTDPIQTFAAMQSVMRATSTIEVTAKLAGSLTQAINRLVSIQ